MRNSKKLNLIGILGRCGIILFAMVFITPLILTIKNSFFIDGLLSMNGYKELFFNCFPFYPMFWNSICYSFTITFTSLIISIFAAFGFRFAHFRGKNLIYVIYLILMMMPLQVMILPNYIGLRDMGLLNTRWAIILPLIFSPFYVVVLHQYMKEIDISAIEAARLDTNSVICIVLHCIIPEIKVCIAAASLFVFADMWNMVEQPMLFVDENRLRTLTAFFEQSEQFHSEVMFPAAILFMLPIFFCYLMFREELVNSNGLVIVNKQ